MTTKAIVISVALLFCLATIGLLGATTAACGKWVPWDCFSLVIASVVIIGLEVTVIGLWSMSDLMLLPPSHRELS
jgi:hypothetical protein